MFVINWNIIFFQRYVKCKFINTFPIAEPPSKPQGPLKVLETQRTSATIEWQPPKHDGGLPLTHYILEKREALRTMWNKVEKVDASILQHTVAHLTEGNEYYFRVMAENEAGVGPALEMDYPVMVKSPYGKKMLVLLTLHFSKSTKDTTI